MWAQYTLRVKNRDQLQTKLQEKGIPTAIHYPVAMHEQPVFKDLKPRHDLSESEKAAREVLSLPLYADMPKEHVSRVISAVRNSL